jgi:hypothetical protein
MAVTADLGPPGAGRGLERQWVWAAGRRRAPAGAIAPRGPQGNFGNRGKKSGSRKSRQRMGAKCTRPPGGGKKG